MNNIFQVDHAKVREFFPIEMLDGLTVEGGVGKKDKYHWILRVTDINRIPLQSQNDVVMQRALGSIMVKGFTELMIINYER